MRTSKLSDFLDTPLEEVGTSSTAWVKGRKVPNRFPTLTNAPYKIALIGEAPGRDEELQGVPFVGMSGRLLNALLSRANISREACFVGNICQYRPPGNDISRFSRDGEEFQEGLSQLYRDLEEFKPNLCVLLGKTALWALCREEDIGNRRGSLFVSSVYKCLPTYHPAACLRQYEWTAVLQFDLHKARREGESPDLILPQRNLIVNWSADEIISHLEEVRAAKKPIAIDIEGGVEYMSCISIAISDSNSFIVPFKGWKIEEECHIWQALTTLLEDPEVPKILQNSLYDRFVLQYSYNIIVRGVVDDTMLKHWEKFCELEKSLAFQSSIYTKEPYYKSERKSDDDATFYTYCCKDSAVTYEINQAIKLDPQAESHYRFNVALLNPLLYMELRGIRYDKPRARTLLNEVNNHLYHLQYQLDRLSGHGIDPTLSRGDLLSTVSQIMCYKKNLRQPKQEFLQDYEWITARLAKDTPLSEEELGRISVACKLSMNVKSDKFKIYLYRDLKLPIQRNRATGMVSTDNESLLKIQKTSPHKAVELAINIMELRTRAQNLAIGTDEDGRIRCGYNVVGTVTGRLSCYKSPTGSGANMQTIPDDYPSLPEGHPLRTGMRGLCLADEGYWMFQCDLKGSDGWTVGAYLAALGDRNMLDDLLSGVKPAARLCYMLRHGNYSLIGKDRIEIKELLKEIQKDSWDYFACKIGIWGVCYLMGPDLLAAQIAEESYGKVNLSRKEVVNFRDAVFAAYRLALWHSDTSRKLAKSPTLTAASGHTRRFYGRREEILGQALAHLPQANTTYATNLAALRLWSDSENRTTERQEGGVSLGERVRLRIEPLHQVHDALIGQFKKTDTPWAVNKIKSYFDNTLIIAGMPIIIPFEGNYGPSWGSLKEGTI